MLNEVDWGMKRTDYRNVAADLATALHMNYAYGVEFVEVDPIALGTEEFEEVSEEDRAKLKTQITVDKSRYRGLHGSALLSRFPLENVRLQPFEQQPHDWYKAERESVQPLEAGKSFWAKQALGILTGVRLPTLLLTGMNTYRTQADPTVRSIPLVASNPEAEFFNKLKDFRFADGNAFDFRGERERSIGGKDDPLANSNERGDKGFITTFEVERTIAFVGKFKLDWIFVKPVSLTEPYAKDQPHKFAPHFGRTLKLLNEAPRDRISDHAPIMVDLPIAEPPLGRHQVREADDSIKPGA